VLKLIFRNVFKLSYKPGKIIREEDIEISRFDMPLNYMYGLSSLEKCVCNIISMYNLAKFRIGKSDGLGIISGSFAGVLSFLSLFKLSRHYHKVTYALNTEIENPLGIAHTIMFSGVLHYLLGEFDKSMEYYEKGLDQYTSIGDMWEVGMIYNLKGHTLRYTGDYKESLDNFISYLEISQKIKDEYGISSAMSYLALAYIENGDYEKALEWNKKSLKISVPAKILYNVCFGYIHMGYLYEEKGDFKKAVNYLEKARKLYTTNLFLQDWTCVVYHHLANNYIEDFRLNIRNFDFKQKWKYLLKIKRTCSIALLVTSRWANHKGAAWRVMGKYCALKNKKRKAERCFKRSVLLTEKIGRRYELGRSLYEYGHFVKNIGRENEAKERWERAYKVFTEIASKEYIDRCKKVLSIKEDREDDTSITSQDRLKTERRMNTVLDTSRYLSSILVLEELLDKIMNSTIELVGAERGALLLYPDEDENKPHQLEIKVIRDVKEETKKDTFHVSQKILSVIEKEMKPLIITDALTDHDLKTRASVIKTGLKSVLCSPIMIKGELLGVIYLDSRLVSGLFSEDDLQVLELLASQSAVSIQNARLYKKSIVKERMERDLQIGGEIQKYFLPKKIEKIKNFLLDPYYSPAEFIGGDYFDVVKMGKDKYGVIIVDISGHGSSAAIVMSVISFIFHSVIEKIKSPAKLMDILSSRLLQRLKAEKYATGIFLIYDAKTGSFEYTNAGHNDPIVYNKKTGKIQELTGGKGMPIGVFEDAKFTNGKYKLLKGDILLLQTDGVYETMNEKRQQFDLERVKKILQAHAGQDPEAINKSIISEVSKFRGDKPQADDITIITMKKVG